MDEDPPEFPDLRPAFEVLVLGSGGGPLETDLSAYLVKPAETSWDQGCISLEAGSGIGSLVQLLQANPRLLSDVEVPGTNPYARAGELFSYVRSYLITHAHLDHVASLILGSGGLPPPVYPLPQSRQVFGSENTLNNLALVFGDRVWPRLGGYPRRREPGEGSLPLEFSPLIFPPKSDLFPQQYTPLSASPYLSALAFPISHGTCENGHHSGSGGGDHHQHRGSSSSASDRGRNSSSGSTPTLSNTASPAAGGASLSSAASSPCVHPPNGSSSNGSGSSWPNLNSLNPAMLSSRSGSSGSSVSVASCGSGGSAGGGRDTRTSYQSTAFFVRNEDRGREFCFFGDVEPDALSLNPHNRRVWTEFARRFNGQYLDTLFIECSYPSSRPPSKLFGHLSPPHLLAELATLASLCPTNPTLKGLRVCLIHCKQEFSGWDVRAQILQELREGARERLLPFECEWVGVERGTRLRF